MRFTVWRVDLSTQRQLCAVPRKGIEEKIEREKVRAPRSGSVQKQIRHGWMFPGGCRNERVDNWCLHGPVWDLSGEGCGAYGVMAVVVAGRQEPYATWDSWTPASGAEQREAGHQASSGSIAAAMSLNAAVQSGLQIEYT